MNRFLGLLVFALLALAPPALASAGGSSSPPSPDRPIFCNIDAGECDLPEPPPYDPCYSGSGTGEPVPPPEPGVIEPSLPWSHKYGAPDDSGIEGNQPGEMCSCVTWAEPGQTGEYPPLPSSDQSGPPESMVPGDDECWIDVQVAYDTGATALERAQARRKATRAKRARLKAKRLKAKKLKAKNARAKASRGK